MSVDPGELALATIGVSAIIDADIPRMGIERQRQALSIPNKLQKLAADVVDGDIKRPPMPRPHSYRKLLDHFAKGLQPDQIQSLMDAFPHDVSDMSGSFLLVAQAALEDLKKLFPMSVYSTFTGPQNLTPDDVSVWRFFSQLEVLDDPLRVYPLIATGALLKSQTMALREIYPTLSDAIDTSVNTAIAKKSAESVTADGTIKYRLPPRAEMGVATWLGRRIVPHQPNKPAPPAPPAGTPTQPTIPNALATRNQKAIANT
jgi:hypothetical protein